MFSVGDRVRYIGNDPTRDGLLITPLSEGIVTGTPRIGFTKYTVNWGAGIGGHEIGAWEIELVSPPVAVAVAVGVRGRLIDIS